MPKTDYSIITLLCDPRSRPETGALYQAAARFIAAARRQSGAGYFDNLNDDQIRAEFRGWMEAEATK